MALLESNPLTAGAPLPAFDLPGVAGGRYASTGFDAPILAVMFLCGHCPYVQAVEERIVALASAYSQSDVQFVAICSNDATDYPDDRPEALRERARRLGFSFPYLVDETQEVAKAFDAVCTPEFYVFDAERTLRYHGRLDDNWRDPAGVTREDLREAIDALRAGKPAPAEQVPSMGCSIKWKS